MPATVLRRLSAPSSRRVRQALGALVAVVIATGVASHVTRAAGTITLSPGFPYAQDFNTLASTGTANTTVPEGWEFSESGTNANTAYRAGTGSDNAGDTYSFGASGSTDRAFGGIRSGTLVPVVGAQFTNTTGSTITQLAIAYTGEQWRLGQNTVGRSADRLDFQLSTNATSLTSGTWVDYDTLDFASPVVAGTVGALNGNDAANRRAVSATLTGLSIPDNATFWIRWVDTDLVPGADDGLAIDDFSIEASGGGGGPVLPTLSVNDVNLNEGNSGTTAFTFTVSLSAPAPAGGVTFDVSTADNTATVADGDYSPVFLTGQVIAAGTMSTTVTVLVNGDMAFEADETFTLNVTNIVGANAGDAQGLGTILNDDVACGGAATLTSQIQGSGATSPLVGSIVTIEGVVVADFQGTTNLSGYYVQEEDADADGDPATSEGIFVFDNVNPASAGDIVRVTGRVTEFTTGGTPLTELTAVSQFAICGSGAQVTPTPVTLPVATLADLERYEGMLVTFPQALTVTGNFTLGRFGEVELSVNGRQWIPTHVAAPGAPALAQQDLNDRSRIVLDDASGSQNIDPIRHPAGGLSASNTLRAGDTVQGPLSGILDHRFGTYRVQPLGPVSFVATNPRTGVPGVGAATLKVASLNVLNYFNGDGFGGGFPTSRGANTPAEFVRQRDKTIATLAGLDADIVGLVEIENDAPGGSAIEDLVAGLNAATGAGTYAYIDTGIIGGDEIRVALIYRPGRVTPTGAHAVLDSTVDPEFLDQYNRPVLAQTFQATANGAKLTVVVTHLKSKGSACNVVGDPDTGDGQGNCNVTRTRAARALVRWLATDPTGSQESDIVILGDLNAYRNEDPITAIRAGGYVDLLGASAYSYVFGGQSGYLDHALASASLASQVTGVTEWHVNADEPTVLDYNVEFKSASQITSLYAPTPYRSSDHDPVVIGLALRAPFDFDGFGRPIDAGGVTDARAGSAVPVKFSLGGYRGLDIFVAGSPSSVLIPCSAGATLVDGEAAGTAGASGLRYDAGTDQYTFVWKTNRAWAGTCRRLTLRLTDGTWHRTDFSFR